MMTRSKNSVADRGAQAARRVKVDKLGAHVVAHRVEFEHEAERPDDEVDEGEAESVNMKQKTNTHKQRLFKSEPPCAGLRARTAPDRRRPTQS